MSSVIGDYNANCNKITALISGFYDNADSSKLPDIIFLPEVWTLGWYTDCFRELAKDIKMQLNFYPTLQKI